MGDLPSIFPARLFTAGGWWALLPQPRIWTTSGSPVKRPGDASVVKTGDNCVMFLDQEKLNANESPIGLRISAVLLAALGCLFVLYVLMFGLLLSVSVFRRLQSQVLESENPRSLLTLVMGVVVTAGLTYLCFRAAGALRNARRWGRLRRNRVRPVAFIVQCHVPL